MKFECSTPKEEITISVITMIISTGFYQFGTEEF
jgi:hypothetical protein